MKQLCLYLFLTLSFASFGQHFQVKESKVFKPKKKKIVLLQDSLTKNKLIAFRTPLHVNTDGTPLSYHPEDLLGETKAINTIRHAVVVKRAGEKQNLMLPKDTYKEALEVFKKYRDSGYDSVPKGYTIKWDNVLAATNKGGKPKPCIFSTGVYKGYYGSLTSLKNGLVNNKGECDCNNQVNPLEVPTLVLPKSEILKNYGAALGDLVILYNPANNALVYAVIGDSGPENNLGEASVSANMLLLKKTKTPQNKKETYALNVNDAVVMIIPQSKKFKKEFPYSKENVAQRTKTWLEENKLTGEAAVKDWIVKTVMETLK